VKILVLLPESPFPWSHTASRYYGPMLKELDRLGHEVTALAVGSLTDSGNEPSDYFDGTRIQLRFFDPPPPRPVVERKIRSAWRSGWELSRSSFGAAAREDADRNYDLVLAEQVSTARCVEDRPDVVCTVQSLRYVDLEADRTSLWHRVRQAQVKREEVSTLRRVRRIRVLTAALARRVATLAPETPTAVVPLCIDPQLYDLVSDPSCRTVGVIGSMFWPPSRAAARVFIEQTVPRLRSRQPELKFLVAGWQSRRYLGDIAAAAGVELIENFRNPRDIFARLSVLVYTPPAGTGMKVKVLEAMAFGVPVVVNENGLEGLEAEAASGVRLAASHDETCEAVLEFLEDGLRRRTAITAGRMCLERSFSPEVVVPVLLERFANPHVRAAHV
jgi:glycosyltransferase involved in cell wall biosynthesis